MNICKMKIKIPLKLKLLFYFWFNQLDELKILLENKWFMIWLRLILNQNQYHRIPNYFIFYLMTQSYCGAFNSQFFFAGSRQAWPNYHFVCATNEDRFPCFLHVKLSWCMIYIDVPAKTTFDRWNLYYVKRLKKGKTWLVFTIGWFLSWPYSCYDIISFRINFIGITY